MATPHASGQINVPRLNGILSVSRALGDAAIKKIDGAVASADGGAALSATPEVSSKAYSQPSSDVIHSNVHVTIFRSPIEN